MLGIGLFKYAVCSDRIEDTVKAMRYVADLVGVKHVALGSDFDGSKTAVDASGLVLLTGAMLGQGRPGNKSHSGRKCAACITSDAS